MVAPIRPQRLGDIAQQTHSAYCRTHAAPIPRTDQDTLTAADLAALFAPLRHDYALIVAATAHLPNAERAARVLPRVEAYSDALSAALAGALDDATALVRGERARGGVR